MTHDGTAEGTDDEREKIAAAIVRVNALTASMERRNTMMVEMLEAGIVPTIDAQEAEATFSSPEERQMLLKIQALMLLNEEGLRVKCGDAFIDCMVRWLAAYNSYHDIVRRVIEWNDARQDDDARGDDGG
jgi:hypothetical protein